MLLQVYLIEILVLILQTYSQDLVKAKDMIERESSGFFPGLAFGREPDFFQKFSGKICISAHGMSESRGPRDMPATQEKVRNKEATVTPVVILVT